MNELTAMIIGAVFFGVFALICFIISGLQFQQKGFLFNNAYLWASEQERKTMDKKPYYRQSAIVFLLLGVSLTIFAVNVFFDLTWLWVLAYASAAAAVIYAIASAVKIETKR